MLNSLKVSFWALVATVVLYASGSFQGMGIGSVAYAQASNPNLTDVGVLVTEQTQLDADEILELFAVEQKALVVPIGIDISVPLMIESAQFYLLIRDSISGQWNRYYFTAEEWNTTLKPYFEATDVSILTAPAGADVDTTAAAQAVLAVGNSVYTGVQVANVTLYGSANGPQGAPQLAPAPHVEPVPPLSTTVAMDQIGSLGGQFRVTESGAANYSVPISLASGTAGVAPEVSLIYSSGQGNGIAGLGWSISGMSSISRCRQTLAQDKMTAPISWLDTDAYCLDGQRLIHIDGTYGQVASTYRLQIDNSSLITIVSKTGQDPTSFKVQRADGSTSFYGLAPISTGVVNTDNDALLNRVAPSGEGKTLTWALKKVEDSVGNPIWYEYDTNTTRQLITDIKYAYGASTNVSNGYGAKVTFEYSITPRTDLQTGYVGGHLFSNDKILTKISTFNRYKPTPGSAEIEANLRTYNLAYMNEDTVPRDHASRLVSIQECSGSSCLSPTTFNWRLPDSSPATTSLGSVTLNSNNRVMLTYQVGDINGDGLSDFAWIEGKPDIDGTDPFLKYALSSGSGYPQSNFVGGGSQVAFDQISHSTRVKMRMIDYNLDGKMDVIVYDTQSGRWKVYLSTPQDSGAWRLSNTSIDIGVTDEFVTFVDMDSNGTTDIIYKTINNLDPNSRIYVRKLERNNQPASSATAYSFSAPIPLIMEDGDATILGLIQSYSADFNGDGRADIFISEPGPRADNAYFNNTKISAYVLTGDPNADTLTMKHYANLLDETPSGGPGGRIVPRSLRFADINGDGLSDVFYQTSPWMEEGNILRSVLRINKGNGEFDYQVIDEPTLDDTPAFRQDSVEFLDWNMDGYLDITWRPPVSSTGTVKRTSYIKYWNPNTQGFGDKTLFGETIDSHKISVAYPDVNGDGVQDRSVVDTRNGSPKITTYSRQEFIQAPFGFPVLGAVLNRAANKVDRITNGLGMVTKVDYEPLSISDHYSTLQLNTTLGSVQECEDAFVGDEQQFCFDTPSIVLDVGGYYEALNKSWSLPPGTQSVGKFAPVLEFNGPMYVVTDVSSDLPTAKAAPGNVDQAAMSSISYYYERANVQAAGTGFLGFKKLTTIDNQKGVKSSTVYRQDWPFIGYPMASAVQTEAGHLLSASTTNWGLQGYNTDWFAIVKDHGTVGLNNIRTINRSSKQHSYDLVNNGLGQGALLSTVTTESLYNTEGSPTWIKNETIAPNDEVIKSVTTTNSYFDTAELPLREARLKDVKVDTSIKGYADIKTRESSFLYYGAGSKRGLLNRETVKPDTNDPVPLVPVVTTHGYDEFGNILKSKVESGGETRCDVETKAYETRGRYIERTYNCLGKLTAENLERDKSGAITYAKAHIDSNKSIKKMRAFSASGKEYFSRDETGGFKENGMSTNVADCPIGSAYTTTTRSAGGGESKICFDKLGREVRTLNRGFDGVWDAQDTEYDNLSRVRRKSEPFDLSEGPQYWTTNDYDLHDRIVFSTAPDQSTSSISYSGLIATTTNDLGHIKIQEKDIIGQVVRVQDHLGAQTFYKHDHFGNLAEMTNSGGNTTVISYDALGRKKSMSDPDRGNWTYTYTPFGELKLQTDAKGQTSEMTYDGLGRMTSRVDQKPIPNSTNMETTNQSTWVYSTAGKGNGLLTLSQDLLTGYVESYSYDNFGRGIGITKQLDGQLFFTKSTFDQYGRPFQSFDAAGDGSFEDHGTVVTYNSHGFVKTIEDANYVEGSSRAVYKEVLAMNARGQVTSERLGGEIDTTMGYFEDTGRLEKIFSSSDFGQVQDLRYQWDTVGNLEYRHEFSGSKELEESFEYDEVNRLITQTVDGESSISVTYDDVPGKRLGNIASKTGVGSYEYGAGDAGPHAVTKAGSVDFEYDLNGNNISSSDGRTIDYTTFDKPSKITKGGHVTEFFYDTSRARYKRIDTNNGGVTTTLYLGGVEIIDRPDGTTEKKRYLGGVVVQTIFYGDNDIEDYREDAYTLKDHLGSIDVIVESDGSIRQEMSFDAWGQRRNATNWQVLSVSQLTTFDHNTTTRGFTGHEMLDEVGIVHMNGRIYDPRIARFLSADPIIQDPYSTQSLNRYSYLWNNPLNGTDPTGYITVKQAFGIVVGAVVAYATFGAGWAVAGKLGFATGAAGTATAATVGTYAVAGAVSGAFAGFASTIFGGGTLKNAFASAGWGALSGAAFGAVGGHFKVHHNGSGSIKAGYNLKLSPTQFSKLVLAHAVTGGVLSELQGGKFGHGFLSAGISKFTTPQVMRFDNLGVQFATTMIIGGTISKVTGGKFANGAATAAIQFVVNAEPTANEDEIGSGGISGKLRRWIKNKSSENEIIEELFFSEDSPLSVETMLKKGNISVAADQTGDVYGKLSYSKGIYSVSGTVQEDGSLVDFSVSIGSQRAIKNVHLGLKVNLSDIIPFTARQFHDFVVSDSNTGLSGSAIRGLRGFSQRLDEAEKKSGSKE